MSFGRWFNGLVLGDAFGTIGITTFLFFFRDAKNLHSELMFRIKWFHQGYTS